MDEKLRQMPITGRRESSTPVFLRPGG